MNFFFALSSDIKYSYLMQIICKQIYLMVIPHGVVANVLNYDLVSKFKLKSCYYFHFYTITLGKGMNQLFLSVMG